MDNTAEKPPSEVTSALFRSWRNPRRGTLNPENMTNPVWEWLVRSRLSAYHANDMMEGPCSTFVGPCWCFDRYGQTSTQLPDGRTVLIGGEHEDYYDPNFFIYNDVVVVGANDQIEILAYPEEALPPTDFHSATLLDDYIILVGCLGYPKQRNPEATQVLCLDLDTWQARRMSTHGQSPGWINRHTVKLRDSGRELVIAGGKLYRGDPHQLIENIDDWCLDLRTWRWSRLTQRPWTRFEARRTDGQRNHLWEMRRLIWKRSVKWEDEQAQTEALTQTLGAPPRLDVLEQLYVPAVADDDLREDNENHGTYRIRMEGVIVRYVENWNWGGITVTVEGEVSKNSMLELKRDLVDKFTLLEQAPIECISVEPQ